MHISEITVYPIKSLGGISVESSVVKEKGLQFDRRWLLVNEKNEFLTQRNFPSMATLSIQIENNNLRISDNENQMIIPLESTIGEAATVKIWSDRVSAAVYEKTVNDWFSSVLGINCRLVSMAETAGRKVNYFYALHKEDTVSFADACPFLLIGENSLSDLNEKLDKPIPMNRFRPNFTVSGAAAFAEDNWRRVKIGETIFQIVKPCARCTVTTINQQTGISDGHEPLKTLAGYRIPKRSIKKKIIFGQYLIAENPGKEIKIGDAVEILETKN